MEPGQSCALYVITLPGLHCVSVWSGMPKQGFRACLSRTSSRQPHAFCCQAHLGCFTCVRDPGGAASFSRVFEPPAESKKIAALHLYAREGSQRCRTYARTVEDVPRYQMAMLWRAFVCCAEANATASDDLNENTKHSFLKNVSYIGQIIISPAYDNL